MKIILDLRSIHGPESGDGRFAVNLIRCLSRLDAGNEYTLYVRPGTQRHFAVSNDRFRMKAVPIEPYSVREQFILPRLVREDGAGLFHSFTYSMPYFVGCPTILTIYDTIHARFGKNYPFAVRLHYEVAVKRCARKADRIVTISRHSKEDIVKSLGVPEGKVRVIYCGCEERFTPMDKVSARETVRRRYALGGAFLLYVGNMRPHKNISTLVRAFGQCLKERPGLELVLCSRNAFSYRSVKSDVDSLGLGKSVHFLDSVDDEALPYLYNAADAFVFPSLYEGFGLPPLEAISCGTPVVSSNAGSLPEVLKDAALFCDPTDAEGLSRAMTGVMGDAKAREDLARKGLERSGAFSWERSAGELLAVYSEFAREPAPPGGGAVQGSAPQK